MPRSPMIPDNAPHPSVGPLNQNQAVGLPRFHRSPVAQRDEGPHALASGVDFLGHCSDNSPLSIG